MVQSDLDLLLLVPPGLGRRAGLEEALRRAIRTGALQAGARLPSSRVLAADLNVSRGTVVGAYDQLAAEGWITIRPASGTVVAEAPLLHVGVGERLPLEAEAIHPRHDLRPGRPEYGSFPRTAWAAAVRSVLALAPHDIWDYGQRFGRPELRRELAAYLGRVRGVLIDPGRLVVCAGFSHGLGLVASLLAPGPIAVEEFALARSRATLEHHGHTLVPIPVDDHGAVVDMLDRLDPTPRAVLLTPAHQYPLGSTLSPGRRHEVLRWAIHHDAIVIEDDYDGEFRYDRQSVGALQGLDPNRIVYGGTASKTLAPALRLGWFALPATMASNLDVVTSSARLECPVPVIDQLALAEMLRCGAYDRHVRRMRLRYHRRRDELLHRLTTNAQRAAVTGIAAGLHAVVRLPAGVDEASVLAACAARQVAVGGLRTDAHLSRNLRRGDVPEGIIVGYATPAAHAFGAAIDAFTAALSDAGLGQ